MCIRDSATNAVNKMKIRELNQKIPFPQGKEISFLDRSLNPFKDNSTITTAMKKANNTTKKDSLKNWFINWLLCEPIDFRMPTSFALFSDLAVLRFIKFIQAKSNTNAPIMPKSHTYFILPPDCFPFSKLLRKYQSFIGKRKSCGSNSAVSSFRFFFTSLMVADTFSIVVLSAICTNIWKELLPH